MNNDNKSRQKTAKEKSAFRFLCVVLSFMVVFVSVVCVMLEKRNDDIRQSMLKPQSGSAGETGKQAFAPKNTENSTAVAPETTDTEKTTATTPPSTSGTSASSTEGTTKSSGSLGNPAVVTINEANWNMTLVNSNYRLPSSYEPELVYVCGSAERLDKRVAPFYEKMFNAAKADNIDLTPCSGYRSYELQEKLYNRKIDYYTGLGQSHDEAAKSAAEIVMPPGSSEHNLGFAMDIVCVENWFENTDEFEWLQEHAADYGFILRYPKDTKYTKVIYEPWHWRFVGVDNAKAIKASGKVLEQYLGVY